MLYFVTLAGAMLYLNMILLGRRHWAGGERSKGLAGHSLVRVLAVVAALIGFDVLVTKAGWRHDNSAEKLYTLSAESKALINQIPSDRPVYIQAYYSPEVPREYVEAKANLLVEGAGHSAALHSNNESNIRSAGVALPVSRLVVNQPCAFTAGGSLTNGLAPTTTLGCGSWGGNSISENLDYKHLMNVSRIGKVITGKKVPTDAEIWA